MKKLTAAWRLSIALCLSLTVTAPAALAQDNAIGGVSVRIVSVKPDAQAQFEAAVADLAESLGEQGALFFHVYQRERGANLPSYTVISQDPVFGEMPQVNIDPAIINRIVSATNGSDLVSVLVDPNLGIQGEGGLEPPAPYLRTRLRVTAASRRQDFIEWQTAWADILEEAGLDDLRVGRIILGGNLNTFVIWTFQDDMNPGLPGVDIEGTIGLDRAERLGDQARAMMVAEEDYILRFREDLSFTAAQ
jgi:hypothetical protein